MGHNLYLLLTSYKDVEGMLSLESVNSETLEKIDEKIVDIYGYSMSVDSILGNDSLHNVANKFRKVLSEIQNNQPANNQSQGYGKIKDMLQEWRGIIGATYYDKSDIEGGKAKLENNDFSNVESFEKRIEDYYQGIIKK